AATVGDWVAVGDTLRVTAGCDRRFASCKAKFGNAVNFRGFPHIPGSDYVLRHPRHGDALDGRAVVR
ncbi:MAG TPA: phage BR0599 family protein, partial [Devosia sp.]|nr:phage BR0599 family protein [Devosia sp.]